MSGRTSWYPTDAAEHDRELNVELGDEFGPAGPLVMRVMKDLAAQQSLRTDGTVRTGFRVLALKAAKIDRDECRRIVERAGEIGALDDLVIDEDGRRFTCRVSGWKADFRRGKETLKKGDQRAGDTSPEVETDADPSATDEDVSPSTGDMSPKIPPTGHDTTSELRSEDARDGDDRGDDRGGGGLRLVAGGAGGELPKIRHGRKVVPEERHRLALTILASFNRQMQTSHGAYKATGAPSASLSRILTFLAEASRPITPEIAEVMIANALRDPYWRPGPPSTGNVFGGQSGEKNLEAATATAARTGSSPGDRFRKYDQGTPA